MVDPSVTFRTLLTSEPSRYARGVRRLADAVMSVLARVLIRVFFRDLEVAGGAALPPTGPTVLVANHQNGLVDGLVLMAALSRHPRFLGKSTLWKILPLRPFLALAGVIPVYRAVEGNGSSPALPADRAQRNDQAFTTSRHLLGEGAMVTVFPEGISHDRSTVQQLRTGAARIALGASADDAIPNVVVTAAGLVYDDKSRFRSRALVRVGPPRPVGPYGAAYRRDPRDAVHALTTDIAADLRAVAPDYRSWDLAARCDQLAEVVTARPGPAAPSHLADRDAVARRVEQRATTADGAGTFEALSAAVTSYHRDVALLGLSDEQVIADASTWRYRCTLTWSVLKVMVAAPVAGVGITVHAVPYSFIKVVARLPDNEGMKATVKVGGCFGLFTLTYVGLAVAVARRRGVRAGAAALVMAPVSGYVAVLASERLESAGGMAQTVDVLRRHRPGVAALRSRRAELAERVERWLGRADPV